MLDIEKSCEILALGLRLGNFNWPWAGIANVAAINNAERKKLFMSFFDFEHAKYKVS